MGNPTDAQLASVLNRWAVSGRKAVNEIMSSKPNIVFNLLYFKLF